MYKQGLSLWVFEPAVSQPVSIWGQGSTPELLTDRDCAPPAPQCPRLTAAVPSPGDVHAEVWAPGFGCEHSLLDPSVIPCWPTMWIYFQLCLTISEGIYSLLSAWKCPYIMLSTDCLHFLPQVQPMQNRINSWVFYSLWLVLISQSLPVGGWKLGARRVWAGLGLIYSSCFIWLLMSSKTSVLLYFLH